jgi:glucose/arabinose dehydrogenase
VATPIHIVCRAAIAALVAALLTAGCSSTERSASTTEPAASAEGLVAIGAGIQGPATLKATVYSSGLPTMSAFAFDSQGRLWVAASGATGHAKDGIYLVRHSGASPVKVVGGLQGPLGLTWSGDWLYVASIGHVDAFGGLRGSKFTRRRAILKGPVAGGENNNLIVGPGGRLVMGISASCDHCKPRSRWSATIVSFRTDGSDLRVDARGVRAAFGSPMTGVQATSSRP